MVDDTDRKFERLQKLAEDRLRKNEAPTDEPGDEITRLIHELRVHQIELNMQNKELRGTQAALATSKQAYSFLFDHAPIAYFVVNENGIIVRANLTATEKFGMARYDLEQLPFSRLVASEERDKYYQHHRALVQSLQPQSLNVWFGHTAIEPFYGKMESIVANDNGDDIRFYVAITDVTECKQMEDMLRKSESYLRSLIETETAFVMRLNMAGDYTYVNQAYADWCGYEPDELLGTPVMDTIAWVDHKKSDEAGYDALANPGKPVRVSLSKIMSDGSQRQAMWEYIALTNGEGEVHEIQCVGFDVTEQHGLGQALRCSEARFRMISEIISDYAYAVDVQPDGTLHTSWIAGAFTEITGYTPEEFSAQGGWRHIFYPEDLPVAARRTEQLLAGEEDVSEFRVITKSGDIRWLKDYGRSVWDEQQQRVTRIYGAAQDITEQKKTEEALRDSEYKYRSLAENVADGLVIWDARANKSLYISSGYKRQLGVKPDEELTLTEAEFFTLWHPDDIEAALAPITEAVENKRDDVVFTLRIKHRDGHYIWQENHLMLEYAPDGTYERGYSIARDITERKRMEEALRHSEKEFRTLVENIPDTVQRLTREGVHLYVNPLFAQQVGMTQADIIGKSNKELGLPSDLIKRLDAFRETAYASKQAVDLDFDFAVAGETRYFSTRLVPELDEQGNVVSLLGITRDITERKRMEEALARSEARYRLVTENSSDSIALHQPDGRFVYVNPAACALYGYTEDELLKMKHDDLVNLVHPNDLPKTRDEAHQEVLQGKPISKLKYRLRRKDGTYAWVENHTVPLMNEVGQVEQLLSATRDISKEKQMEWALRQSEERFRTLTELAPVGIVAHRDFRVLYANKTIAKMVGKPDPAQLLGQNILGILPEAAQADAKGKLQHVLATGDELPHTERTLQLSNGETMFVQTTTRRIVYDGQPALITVLHNITPFKQALQREQEERAFVRALLEMVPDKHGENSLSDILNQMLAQLVEMVTTDGMHIMLLEDNRLSVVASYGFSDKYRDGLAQEEIVVEAFPTFHKMFDSHEPVLIQDTSQSSQWVERTQTADVKAYLGMPIILSGQVLGFLNVHSGTAHHFTATMVERFQAIANHIAVLIQNLKAYELLKASAAEQERLRLSRDLHDAVSQTLFSANMISETLPHLIETDPDTVREGLHELAKLTKGALAEMRMLLIEWRPDTALDTDILVLIRHLENGLRARTKAQVHMMLPEQTIDDNLSPLVKIALYRIAQEAVSNIIKHAQPEHVIISLKVTGNRFKLVVQDDGQGFDLATVPHHQFGLSIIRERAADAELDVSIHSHPDDGTRIEVDAPLHNKTNET